MEPDYVRLNKAFWDDRAHAHSEAPEYEFTALMDNSDHLSECVRFDLGRLGDISALEVVHLQCHIGTDSVSLARLGARVTGLDFSRASLAEAQRLFAATQTEVHLVESEVDDALKHLESNAFDLVYTGIGSLCWLSNLPRWANVVVDLLRPGGRLFLRETHAALWSMAEPVPPGLQGELLHYGSTHEPMEWVTEGTYVGPPSTFNNNRTLEWNHSPSDVITALLNAGMTLVEFVEHRSIPWNALPGRMERVGASGEWRLRDRPERVPHTYTVQAVRSV